MLLVYVLAVIGALAVVGFAGLSLLGWQFARDLKRREFGQ